VSAKVCFCISLFFQNVKCGLNIKPTLYIFCIIIDLFHCVAKPRGCGSRDTPGCGRSDCPDAAPRGKCDKPQSAQFRLKRAERECRKVRKTSAAHALPSCGVQTAVVQAVAPNLSVAPHASSASNSPEPQVQLRETQSTSPPVLLLRAWIASRSTLQPACMRHPRSCRSCLGVTSYMY
jgi:hypothetical protein